MRRVYIYHFHERMWHWVQALVMITLMVTGLEIHWPSTISIIGFSGATTLHEWLGVLLAINAFLGLLYHIFSAQLSQYLPEMRSFIGLAILQVRYYMSGIFKGAPHPIEKTPEKKMNPLQQVTYLAILNILLPIQLFSGLAIWGTRHFDFLGSSLRSIPYLGPLHMVGAWLFIAFVFMHIYLATTGHTVLSNFEAMVTGYEDLPDASPQEDKK